MPVVGRCAGVPSGGHDAASTLLGAVAAAARRAATAAPPRAARGFLTRSGYGYGGGGRGWWDPDRVTWALIGANVGVWALWRVAPGPCRDHAVVSLDALRAGRLHTVAAAAFSHVDPVHLGSNMLGLYFFGRDVGRIFGGRALLALYVAGGVAGSLAHVAWHWWADRGARARLSRYGWAPSGRAPAALGASAAVNAVMLVDILMFPSRTILLYAVIPVPAALLGAFWLWRDVTGAAEGRGAVAHAGHLGGAAAGLAFYVLFRRGLVRPARGGGGGYW